MTKPTKPPVACPHCGGAIGFDPGQLVGNPETIEKVKAMRSALTAWANWWDERVANPTVDAPVSETHRLLGWKP